MHVAHLYNDVFPPVVGGIEKHIDLIRRTLPDVTTEVIVCSRRRRGRTLRRETGLEVQVAELGPRPWSVPIAPTYPLAVRKTKADLVHLHMPSPLGEVSALSLGARPLVCSYHADIVRQARVAGIYRHLIGACLGRASEIIVGSQRLADTSRFLGHHAARATVLPYFVNTDELSPSRVSQPERERLMARYPSPLVLTVARLVYYKGLDVLIDAARTLDASVVIVGDGPLRARLREQASSLKNVFFAGPLSDEELLQHFAVADVFVLPSTSRAESFGIAALEAQSMGVPAVITDVGTGTVEAIDPGKSGLVVAPKDARALTRAISEILDDDERRLSMKAHARENVLARHSMIAAAPRLRALYEKVAGSASRPH